MKHNSVLICLLFVFCPLAAQNNLPEASTFSQPIFSCDKLLQKAEVILSLSLDTTDIIKTKRTIDNLLFRTDKIECKKPQQDCNDYSSSVLFPYIYRSLYMLSLGNYIEEQLEFTTLKLLMKEEKQFFQDDINRFGVSVRNIKTYHMSNDSCDIYYIINHSKKNIVVNGDFNTSINNPGVYCWNPSNGVVWCIPQYHKTKNNLISVTLLLHADESLFLVFDKNLITINGKPITSLVNYQSHFPLHEKKVRIRSWKKSKTNRSTTIYKAHFNIKKDTVFTDSYYIELPYKSVFRKIRINGHDMGGAWFRSIYSEDIEPLLIDGKNELEVEVPNNITLKDIYLYSGGFGVLI